MTDIEQKALALLGEVSPYKCEKVDHAHHAYLCAALRLSVERHEAFRQEVSKLAQFVVSGASPDMLAPLIIPKPKPDPLVEVLAQLDFLPWKKLSGHADDFRAALDALGFEIREKNDG